MNIAPSIDLGCSLRSVLGEANEKAKLDADRQRMTADAILNRYFFAADHERREIVLLADEVGLGKTFVALAVAVSMLDAIRLQEGTDDLPVTKPSALVLTPSNDALLNKWLREAGTFTASCVTAPWLQDGRSARGGGEIKNVVDLTVALRKATRKAPVLAIAKLSVLSSALHDADDWRRRALAMTFQALGIRPDDRPSICRRVLGTGAQANVPELLDLRSSGVLWQDTSEYSPDLQNAFERALRCDRVTEQLRRRFSTAKEGGMRDALDDLTRAALLWDWPTLPLVVIDEVHNLKNEHGVGRKHLLHLLQGRASRVLGLSATPFQLRHEELESVLGLRELLALSTARRDALDAAVNALSKVMRRARDEGDRFRSAWVSLHPRESPLIDGVWERMNQDRSTRKEWPSIVRSSGSRRVEHAMSCAIELEKANRALTVELRRFVIRHRNDRRYRQHWVGSNASRDNACSTPHLAWRPGIEVTGESELAHYLLMRTVSLAKDQKGRAGLGAELTGSYRHLTKTSATWRSFESSKGPVLHAYRAVLDKLIGRQDADKTHPKVQATVSRALAAFMDGRKSVIFCVHVQTAEVIRDRLKAAVKQAIAERREPIFGDENTFANFHSRFFNRREPLFALIQDQPLLHVDERAGSECVELPRSLRLGPSELDKVIAILVEEGESANVDKVDRRLLLAAVEHVAVITLAGTDVGLAYLDQVLPDGELRREMTSRRWVPQRQRLTIRQARDPEAGRQRDPLEVEDATAVTVQQAGGDWHARLRTDTGDVLAPYFDPSLELGGNRAVTPLLPTHHSAALAKLQDASTRATVGQVFRRMLMAEEFLVRFLADIPRDQGGRWAEYLAERYATPLPNHHESLRDRFDVYLDTIIRAQANPKLLADYRAAATNLNVVQMVKGGMDQDRYFVGFNTPYRPEILVSTSVGQEGIDLHRECSHVIHHDLCWNPATIEQRTGRVDRIGSKVERERAKQAPEATAGLDVAVPYLAATYDERMFEELYRRARLFEVTMGGDFRVEGKLSASAAMAEREARETEGVGTLDEDLGEEGVNTTGAVSLPLAMVDWLRVDLSVWKPTRGP